MSDGTARLVHRLNLAEVERRPGGPHPGADPDSEAGEIVVWQGEAGEHAMNMAGRLFGGMILAQTVMAAGRTRPDRRIHSLQQVFLRSGQPDGPIFYRCKVLFEGRTYASIAVEVRQHDEIISHAQVGLTSGVADGPSHEQATRARGDFADTTNRDEYRGRLNWQDQPVEVRSNKAHEDDTDPSFATWLRPYGELPDDPVVHQAVLAFVTDRAFLTTAWKPVRSQLGDPRGATLDHTIWFHRPVRFDDWHVFAMNGSALHDGRGLSQGTVHRAEHGRTDGELVATVTQQGALRDRSLRDQTQRAQTQ